MTTTSSPRRRARELALQALYADALTGDEQTDSADRIIQDENLSDKTLTFSRELYEAVRNNRSWADSIIEALAKNWRLDRLALIDRAILQIALVEIKESPDTPFKVVINEAIELAKTFSTADSASFINGILDSHVKQVENLAGQ